MLRISLLFAGLFFSFNTGCHSDPVTRFEDFLVEHQSCERDDDCAIIGDCGLNADFRAVRADAADEAYRLMTMRGEGIFDGPKYAAFCGSDNRCERTYTGYACGPWGPPEPCFDETSGAAGAICGDECLLCAPDTPGCVEPEGLKYCQADGACDSAVPACDP